MFLVLAAAEAGLTSLFILSFNLQPDRLHLLGFLGVVDMVKNLLIRVL